jgi:hypothetical protein
MKMKFEWEVIDESVYESETMVTARAKVKGGWLILVNIYTIIPSEFDDSHTEDIKDCSTMSFLPDAKHEWQVE